MQFANLDKGQKSKLSGHGLWAEGAKLSVLVPSLLKYIRKAQEAAAIEECAGVVKMAAVERSEWLSEGGTAPTREEIVQSAGANGEINIVKYSNDDFDVTYMRYICKNGIVVIYEYDKDPQFGFGLVE